MKENMNLGREKREERGPKLEPSLNYFDYYQPKKNLHEEHKNKVFR